MRINIGSSVIEWNGGHYGNVTFADGSLDCFSFAWEKSKATSLDFTTSAIEYLKGF